ncbi:hypothetical protein CB1_001456004 [Camelus ferus]|nr:hypothetical protein CB1_001456004 [Camelus ferus]
MPRTFFSPTGTDRRTDGQAQAKDLPSGLALMKTRTLRPAGTSPVHSDHALNSQATDTLPTLAMKDAICFRGSGSSHLLKRMTGNSVKSFFSHGGGPKESEKVKVKSSLVGCRRGSLENPYINDLSPNTSTVVDCQLLKQGERLCRAAAFTYGIESTVVALVDQFAIFDMQARSF